MKNNRTIIAVCLSILLLVILSACGSAANGASSISKNQSQDNNSFMSNSSSGNMDSSNTSSSSKMNDSSDNTLSHDKGHNKSSGKSNKSKGCGSSWPNCYNADNKNSGSASNSASSNGSKSSSNQGNQKLIDARTNAVVHATLKVESKKPDTTVNYKAYTMTQSGQKVGFTVVPDADHQNDFKEGLIREIISHGDKSHEHTLFEYKFANHKLSLIDTGSLKVVYTTNFKG